MSSDSVAKLGRLLRADQDYLTNIDSHLAKLTNRSQVIDKITDNNQLLIKKVLSHLGLHSPHASTITSTLIAKVRSDYQKLDQVLEHPTSTTSAGRIKLIDTATTILPPAPGFFLKLEVAKNLLLKNPPTKVLEYLGFPDVESALKEVDILEIYSALRFIEGSEWLNSVFLKSYQDLTPDDFEIRAIKVISLDDRWLKSAEAFVTKKLHNISHLKEMGVIFVLPTAIDLPGESLRTISLLFHYLHEVSFYSDLIQNIPSDKNFSKHFISLLCGDVYDAIPPVLPNKVSWLVVQRYLAKDDPYDWRLFYPNINPEALHWFKASRNISDLSRLSPELKDDLDFWSQFDSVGDYFSDASGADVLVSFNFVDVAMSFVRQTDKIHYDYHHHAALWNKFFTSYFSISKLESQAKEYLAQGYFYL